MAEGHRVTISVRAGGGQEPVTAARPGDRYKWVALTNTTVGVLLATIDASIMIIAMPDIFRGIKLDPLVPGNNLYLLWMILGYLVTSSVLVVTVGRLGDLFGRVRMYNLGFVIYTTASLLLTIDWMTGRSGALWLLLWRIVQGIGGAFLVGNSGAILTDAFPPRQRGLALGINNIAGISGSFIGLVVGGVLAPINWRLVFLVSVPCGVFGTVWAYRQLRDLSERTREPVDWLGNVTFAAGMILLMVGITQACSRTMAAPWAGQARSLTGSSRPASRCWPPSCSSRPRSRTPCSALACSRSAPSRSGPSPRSCPPSAAAA
jgi:MFS family permease